MNLEGGVGADFLGGGLTTGLVYYASFKLDGRPHRRIAPQHRAGQEQGLRARA